MRIRNNGPASRSYRSYKTNSGALSKNLEKLSSGYQINRSADDAAGLAISEKMRAQVTGLTEAQRNASHGIGLIQTAEGALQEVHGMLNRMLELSTQSANGTYDDAVDRQQLQKEMVKLAQEINRIADTANFNGVYWLNNGYNAVTLQNASSIGSELAQLFGGSTGEIEATLFWNTDDDFDLHCITPSGKHIYWDNARTADGGVLEFVVGSDERLETDGKTVTLLSGEEWSGEHIYFPNQVEGTYKFFVHTWTDKEPENDSSPILQLKMGDKIISHPLQAETNMHNTYPSDAPESSVSSHNPNGFSAVFYLPDLDNESNLSPTGRIRLLIGETGDEHNLLDVPVFDMHAEKIGLAGVNIGTQQGAIDALSKIRTAINNVSDVRGTYGAIQNRLEHTINNLGTMRENIQDAESTIRDTDMAAEMMKYTKNNILVQSAQSMLAQANMLPQGVLGLLQ